MALPRTSGGFPIGWQSGYAADIFAKYGTPGSHAYFTTGTGPEVAAYKNESGDRLGNYSRWSLYPQGTAGNTQSIDHYSRPGSPAGSPWATELPMPPPTAAGFPVVGVAGAAGPSGEPSDSYVVAPPGSTPPPNMGGAPTSPLIPPQGQNAMQMHQQEAATPSEMRPISAARRFFWGTGRIDARAPTVGTNYQGPNALTNFDSTFGANASHLGAASVTWQQRQQTNQQHADDAAAQRGLDFAPY